MTGFMAARKLPHFSRLVVPGRNLFQASAPVSGFPRSPASITGLRSGRRVRSSTRYPYTCRTPGSIRDQRWKNIFPHRRAFARSRI